MRILFALNQNRDDMVENKLLEHYRSITGNEFTFTKEYDLSGVSHKFKFEKFDLLILNEEIERVNPVTTTFIDDLTDKFASSRIILIINPEHKADTYVKRLFNLGVYDLLYSTDISIDNIIKLIIKPRTKAEAKIYLDLHDVDDVKVENELKHIPDDELDNILNYFDSIETSSVESTFEHLYNQYNQDQMLFLIKHLNENTLNLLSGNLLYQELRELLNSRKYTEDIQVDDTPKDTFSDITDNKVSKPIKTKEVIQYKEKIIREKEYIHVKPDDYVKFAGFIGAKGKGKTLIIDLIARCLSDKEIDVSVVDITQNNNFYYKYIWGNDNAKDKNKTSVTNLSEGEFTPYKVNRHYSLYAQPNLPITLDVLAIADRLKINSKVVLIDMDFSNNFIDLSKYILNNVFVVHDLDILDLRHTKNLLLKLLNNNVNSLKVSFIINKFIKSSVTERTIMAMLENPINEVENVDDVGYRKFKENAIFTMCFEEDLYVSNINSSYLPEKEFNLSDEAKTNIFDITNYIYPLPSNNSKKSLFKKIFS